MATHGVGQVAAAHHAVTAGNDDGDDGEHGLRSTSTDSSRKLELLEANRREIIVGMKRAKLQFLWKYQKDVFDFYQDHSHTRPYVQTFVAFLILSNFICQAAQRQFDPNPDNEHRKYKAVWLALDYFFNIAFLIELLVNMYGSWAWPFLRQGWNLFDLLVVSVGCLDMLQLDLPPSLKMIRLFRAFRVFRLFGRIESLRKILASVQHAIPGVINVIVVMFIMMSIYAVLAVDCFYDLYAEHCKLEVPPGGAITARGNCYGEEYYGNFLTALYTLFQILTGESWSEAGVRPIFHYYWYVEPSYLSTFGVAIFFVSFVLINSFVILNVVVAVLLDGMNQATGDDAAGTANAGKKPADVSTQESTSAPRSAKDLDESVQRLHFEVADIKQKVNLLIHMQQGAPTPGSVE